VLLPLKKNIFIKLLSNYGAKHLLKMFLTEDEVLMGKRHWSTRSSAVAERPRDASCYWIFR